MYDTSFMNSCQGMYHRLHYGKSTGNRKLSPSGFHIFVKRLPLHIFHHQISCVILLCKCIYIHHACLFSKKCQYPAFLDELCLCLFKHSLLFITGVYHKTSGSPVAAALQVKFLDSDLPAKSLVVPKVCNSKSTITKNLFNAVFAAINTDSRSQPIFFHRFNFLLSLYVHQPFILQVFLNIHFTMDRGNLQRNKISAMRARYCIDHRVLVCQHLLNTSLESEVR